MKKLPLILLVLLLGVILAPAAQASYSLTFTLTPGFGMINEIPTEPCHGINLQSTAILGLGTPANSGITFLPPDPCIISFTTGVYTDHTATRWLLAGGGSILGTVLETQLLSGAWLDPSLSSDLAGTSHEFQGYFTAHLGSSLLSFFGIPGNPIFQGLADIIATTTD
jgi:hypothetical protein